ncbi:MAG TPA: patatin-like phospholipase family protein [Hyphomonadaceae bacterium]|jgi:NTE family protein|nr:patatin-like phospholipase family protein [Hyphomonadaceae bacterium]
MRIAFASLLFLTACAGTPDVTPVNKALLAPPPATETEIGVDGEAIALALSGGGARAASFSYGALLQLREMKGADGRPLIDRVALVTAVSGGSITAAWFGQHGAEGLDGFRAAALDKDWQSKLHTSFVSPNNWARLLQGGLNGPDRLASWLDKEIFKGGKMGELPNRPRIVINATDLFTGAPFAFSAPYFQAICSDLSQVRIADAVAASMSVPVAFRPVIVESYADKCPSPLPDWVAKAATDRAAPVLLRITAQAFQLYRQPDKMKFVHLTDGGVADNFGLSSLITIRRAAGTPYGPFSARDAVKVKRLTFFVVNAEASASGDWPLQAKGPNGPQLIDAAFSLATNAPKRVAYDAFQSVLSDWQRELVDWRCKLSAEEAARLGARPGWDCKAVNFRTDMISFADLGKAQFDELSQVATVVSLPKETVDHLIAGGKQAIAENALVKELAR